MLFYIQSSVISKIENTLSEELLVIAMFKIEFDFFALHCSGNAPYSSTFFLKLIDFYN